MDAIILAGGLAKRISKKYKSIPKSMIKIGNKPFIHMQLDELKKNKIYNVVICLGHLSEKIEKYVKENFSSNMSIQFCYDGNTKLGTGGAIKKATKLLKSENFLLIYGDSYLIYSYKKIINNFLKNKSIAMNVIYKNKNMFDKSNIDIDKNNLIISMDDKKYSQDYEYIDWGMSVFHKKIFNYLSSTIFELIELKKILIEKKKLQYYEVDERFFEIGSHKGIKDLKIFLKLLK